LLKEGKMTEKQKDTNQLLNHHTINFLWHTMLCLVAMPAMAHFCLFHFWSYQDYLLATVMNKNKTFN